MPRSLLELKNIGPVVPRRLAELGIADEVALRRVGPVATYHRLKFADPKGTTLVALYAFTARWPTSIGTPCRRR